MRFVPVTCDAGIPEGNFFHLSSLTYSSVIAQPTWSPSRLRRTTFAQLGFSSPSSELRRLADTMLSSIVGFESAFSYLSSAAALHCTNPLGSILTASAAELTSPTAVYMDRMAEIETASLTAGNILVPQTPIVVRQALYERRRDIRLSKDVYNEQY